MRSYTDRLREADSLACVLKRKRAHRRRNRSRARRAAKRECSDALENYASKPQ